MAAVFAEEAADSADCDEGSPSELHAATATATNAAHHETRMANDRRSWTTSQRSTMPDALGAPLAVARPECPFWSAGASAIRVIVEGS